LDADQVENLIKFCSTKEMELLKVVFVLTLTLFLKITSLSFLCPFYYNLSNFFVHVFLANIGSFTLHIFVYQNFSGDKETLGKCELVRLHIASATDMPYVSYEWYKFIGFTYVL
jgi:hypothetical protein